MESDSTQPDLAHADIGIVCALPIELGAFLDRCKKVRKYSGGNFVFRGGFYDQIRIAVVQSGMGFNKARMATQALVDAHTPNWILSAGFAGALLPGMKIGDIVMADSVVDEHHHEMTVDLKMPADPENGLHVGRIVTADNMVRLISEKQTLAKKHNAIAVEMESLAVAQVCRDTKTRFLAVRAISDDLSADLPPEVLSVVGSTGTIRFGAAIGSILKRPGSVKDMWGLREKAHKAADQLATFLDGIVTQLYEAKH